MNDTRSTCDIFENHKKHWYVQRAELESKGLLIVRKKNLLSTLQNHIHHSKFYGHSIRKQCMAKYSSGLPRKPSFVRILDTTPLQSASRNFILNR